jgi:hypothetical protein
MGEDWRLKLYGRRRRKNWAGLVAGRVTDLLAPSSATLAELVTQVAGAASTAVCSKANPAVSAEVLGWPGAIRM